MTHYFVAIPIPYPLIEQRLAILHEQFALSTSYKVIPHPADYHITLLFFGPLTSPQLDFVKKELHHVAGQTNTFDLTLDGISFFGNPEGPRVVYLSVEPHLSLTQLVQQLGKRLESVLQKPMTSMYTPHVTIAKKKKEGVSIPVRSTSFPKMTHNVFGMTLFSIEPTQAPKYVSKCTFPFTSSDVSF